MMAKEQLELIFLTLVIPLWACWNEKNKMLQNMSEMRIFI
jgi:hypothetical protein